MLQDALRRLAVDDVGLLSAWPGAERARDAALRGRARVLPALAKDVGPLPRAVSGKLLPLGSSECPTATHIPDTHETLVSVAAGGRMWTRVESLRCVGVWATTHVLSRLGIRPVSCAVFSVPPATPASDVSRTRNPTGTPASTVLFES